jgi:hypothetical protein
MLITFRLAALSLVASLAFPSLVLAGPCEDSFQKKGNAITGLRFTATQSVTDMPPAVAINQVRGLAAAEGFDIMAAEPEAGALLLEQGRSSNARAFPIEVNATAAGGTGTVVMEAKLPAGMGGKTEDFKAAMCGMLAKLKGGREGRTLAAAGARAVAQQAAPVVLSAQEFSQQISKDAERNAVAIPQRYANKQFTLSGTVDYVIRDGDQYRVAYKILQPHEMLIRLPGMAQTLSGVSCLMGPGTSVFVLQLKPGKSIRLTGMFHRFDEFRDHVWFQNCTPAQGR